MNVLIINTNRERAPHTLIPLGACCVASAAAHAGHEVSFLDLCLSRRPIADAEAAAARHRPDVIGLSVRNLDNCDQARPHSYLPEVRRIAEACRRVSGAEMVVGGPAVSQTPAAVAHRLGCRLAVAGEGEVAFPALLRALEQGADPAGVPGVTFVEGPAARSTPPAAIAALGPLPDPQPERWLDLRRYAACDAALPVQSKRGCTFHCSYCCYPLLEGRTWRLRDPEWVASQVARAGASGLRGAEFVDSVFGLPEDHAIACCLELARVRAVRGLVPLATTELNPRAVTPALVEAMNAAGFTAVGITAESGSDAMLASLGKGFTAVELRQAAERLRRLKARKLWLFLLGGPGETEATVRDTVRFIEGLPHSDLVLVTHGIRVLPGTALHARLVAEGALPADADLTEPLFYHSPHVSPERAAQMVAESAFPAANRVTLTDGGHPLAPLVQRAAALLGAAPPYWRHLPVINRVRRALRL